MRAQSPAATASARRQPRAADAGDVGQRQELRRRRGRDAAGRAESDVGERPAQRLEHADAAGLLRRKQLQLGEPCSARGDDVGRRHHAGQQRQAAVARAAATSSGVRPGLTPNTAPASIDCSKSSRAGDRADADDGAVDLAGDRTMRLQRDRRAQRHLEHADAAGDQRSRQRHRMLDLVDDDDRDHRADAHQLEDVHAVVFIGVKTK